MKTILRFLAAASILIIFLSSCSEPAAPAVEDQVITYYVESSEDVIVADISYTNKYNDVVKLVGQSLPWTTSVTLGGDSNGVILLTVEIAESRVFVPFLDDTADSIVTSQQLNDSSVDFDDEGVIEGDVVYTDPTTYSYANVAEVIDEHTLSLSSDIISADDPYYIYHIKTLSASIDLNGETIGEDEEESERSLNCQIQTTVDL